MKVRKLISRNLLVALTIAGSGLTLLTPQAWARDVVYESGEIVVNVIPGEPTQVRFPGTVQGGSKKSLSSVTLDKNDRDLVVFASEGINTEGEALIVRLADGRSYSMRVRLADDLHPRDDVVKIEDSNVGYVDPEEEAAYKEKKFSYAPPSTISGLMREMALFSEFGKKGIPGYRVSDSYRGETVLNDGAIKAAVDVIFIGSNLWGYVLDTENMLDQTVKLNPATFRIDGTRAISASNWELSPRPLNVEQQIAAREKTKVYVITRPKKFN